MATQKIKFSMSLKELSFTFEGDLETGQRLQSDIQKTLAALSHTQERILPPDPNVIEAEASVPTENGKPSKPRTTRPRRPKANSCRAQIIELRRSGFFKTKKDANAIREQLAKAGHIFKPNEVSATLIALCKKKVLKRDQIDGGNYEYEEGEFDGSAGDGEDAE